MLKVSEFSKFHYKDFIRLYILTGKWEVSWVEVNTEKSRWGESNNHSLPHSVPLGASWIQEQPSKKAHMLNELHTMENLTFNQQMSTSNERLFCKCHYSAHFLFRLSFFPPLWMCVCKRFETKSEFNCFFSIVPLFARVIILGVAGGGN